MAMKHSLLIFAIIFFTILLTATAVDLSGNSRMNKAMAVYGGLSISMMKLKLIPNDIDWTCHTPCSSNSDCSGAWVCHWCWSHEDPWTGQYHYWCSMLPD